MGHERLPRAVAVARRQQRPGVLAGNVGRQMPLLEQLLHFRRRPAGRARAVWRQRERDLALGAQRLGPVVPWGCVPRVVKLQQPVAVAAGDGQVMRIEHPREPIVRVIDRPRNDVRPRHLGGRQAFEAVDRRIDQRRRG